MGRMATARVTPGQYDIEVCLELEDGTLTDWQRGRATVDNANGIRLVTQHDWDVPVPRTTEIRSYRVRGLTLTAPLPGPLFVAKTKGRPDTVTLHPV